MTAVKLSLPSAVLAAMSSSLCYIFEVFLLHLFNLVPGNR